MPNYEDFKDNPDAIQIQVNVVAGRATKEDIKKAISDKLNSLSTELFSSLHDESTLVVNASVRPRSPKPDDDDVKRRPR